MARLTLQCPDRPGIATAVSSCLSSHGANVLTGEQYSTGGEVPRFFMRMEFPLDELDTPVAVIRDEMRDFVAPKFGMEWNLSYSAVPPRMVILCTRTSHCVLDLLWQVRTGELAADIVMIISNREYLRSLAERFYVPFKYLPVTPDTKAEQEREILDLIRDRVDLVVLARYMQILTPTFLNEYPRAVINIHHSFLPAFPGADPYRQAHDRGVKIIGATAHYATTELDEGPIIEQDVTRVSHRDSREDLIRQGRELERRVLGRAVRWHIEDRVLVNENKTVVFN